MNQTSEPRFITPEIQSYKRMDLLCRHFRQAHGYTRPKIDFDILHQKIGFNFFKSEVYIYV